MAFCARCGASVSLTAVDCPNCHAEQPTGSALHVAHRDPAAGPSLKRILWITLGVVIALVGLPIVLHEHKLATDPEYARMNALRRADAEARRKNRIVESKGKQVSICEALREQKISIEVVSELDIRKVKVKVAATVPAPPRRLSLPIGTFFVSKSGVVLVSVLPGAVELEQGKEAQLSVRVANANMRQVFPVPGEGCTVDCGREQKELQVLLPLLQKSREAEVQAAVWIVTNDADYEQLGVIVDTPFTSSRVIGPNAAVHAMMSVEQAGLGLPKRSIWKDRVKSCSASFERCTSRREAPSEDDSWCNAILEQAALEAEKKGARKEEAHLLGVLLRRTAASGDVAKLEGLIAGGANVDYEAGAPLFRAATCGHLGVVLSLLDHGANANTIPGQNTALMNAASAGHVDMVRTLLSRGANPHTVASNGTTALGNAASSGNSEVVRILLASGVDVNGEDSLGRTALASVIMRQHLDVARMLLDKGADVNAKSRDGDTALMEAASGGHVDMVRTLLSRGANPHTATPMGTALGRAASSGNSEVVRILLASGVDVNGRDSLGGTALVKAITYNHSGLVRMLLDKGADVNVKGPFGNTALMEAVRHERAPAIVQLLLDRGAEVNGRREDGKTALGLAIGQNRPEIAAILKRAGAKE